MNQPGQSIIRVTSLITCFINSIDCIARTLVVFGPKKIIRHASIDENTYFSHMITICGLSIHCGKKMEMPPFDLKMDNLFIAASSIKFILKCDVR